MQKAMSEAFKQIVVGFVDVTKALGSFVVGAFVDAGKAVFDFTMSLTGADKVLAEMTARYPQFAAITSTVVAAIGTSIGVILAGLAAGSIAMYQLAKEQTAVAQTNAQFGAAFGASTQEVLAFNAELANLNVTSSQASEIFVEVAKAGNIGKESFVTVAKAAADFELYVGGKASDAVKTFSDAIKDPVKELTEFGIKTGYVSQEQVELVKNLLETGKGAEAQEKTIELLGQGFDKMTDKAKSGMSGLDLVLKEVKSSLANVWNEFKNSETVGEAFRLMWETVAVVGAEVWFTLKAVGTEIGGIGAQIAAVLRGDFAGAKSIGEQMKTDAEAAAKAQEALIARILDRSKVQKTANDEERKANSDALAAGVKKKELRDYLSKSDKENLSRQEYINKNVEDWNRKLGAVVMTDKELLQLQKQLGKEWDKAQKKPAKAKQDKTEAKAIETLWQSITDSVNKANVAYDEVVNGADKYTDSQKKMMSIIDNKAFLAMPESLQKEALARLAAAHAIEVQTAELKAFDKATADYWSEYEKQQEKKKEFTTKELADGEIRLAMLDEELAGLLAQKAIYGKLSIEQKQAVENAKAEAAYRKEILEIEKQSAAGQLTTEGALDRTIQATLARDKKIRNIQEAGDMERQKQLVNQYEALADVVADSLVTGLTKGAKAGAKKLREYLQQELTQAITVQVRAMISTQGGGFKESLAAATNPNSLLGGISGLSTGFGAGLTSIANAGVGGWLSASTSLIGTGTLGGIGAGVGMLAGPLTAVAGLVSAIHKATKGESRFGGAYELHDGSVQRIGGAIASNTENDLKTISSTIATTNRLLNVLGSRSNVALYGAFSETSGKGRGGIFAGGTLSTGQKFGTDSATRQYTSGTVEEQQQRFAQELMQSTLYALKAATDIPSSVQDMLNSVNIDDLDLAQATTLLNDIVELPNKVLQDIGTSTEALSDIILLGLQNGDPEGAGKAFAEQITFGIENSLYQGFAQQVTSIISTQLVTPVITAMAKGATITEAMSKASVETMISQVKAAGTAFAAIMNNPEFRSAMDSIGATISGAVSGSFSGIPAAPRAPESYADSFKAAKEAKESTKTASKETDDLAKSLKSLADENTKLQAEYLELTGHTAEAKAMLRALAIEGMSELEIAAYDSNQALRDKIELYKKEQQALESFWSAVERNLSKFMQGDDLRFGRSIFLAQDLNKAGVGTGNLMNDARTLMQLSTKQIKELASAFVLSAENSVEAKTAVLDVAGALIDLADAAANEALKSLVDFYDMLQSNAEKATDKAFAVLEKSIGSLIKNIEDEQKAIEESIKTKEKAIDSIKEVFDVLKNSAAALYNSVTSTNKAEVNKASKFISDALLTALQTGVLPDAKDLEKAIGLVTADLDATQFKTKFDADKQRILLANMLTEFQGLASDQLTDAEKQLAVSNDQLKELENLKVAAQEQLEHWRTQVELARGTYIETIAVKDAINALAAALGVEAQVKADAAKNVIKGVNGGAYDINKGIGVNSSGASFVGSQTKDAAILHLTQGGSAKQIYDVIQGSGFSLAQAEKILGAAPGSFAAEAAKMGLPAFADGGMHSGGIRLVGEEGPELEVTGPARYYNANQTASMLSGNSDKEELEMLRYEVRAVAQHSAKLTRTIERLIVGTNDGEALQTKAVV